MTTLPRLRTEVARRYAALDLPTWPAPHPDGAPPREEEYSRVTDPQRYRIAGARALVWAEVLAEAGAAVVDGPDPARHGDDDARHPGWDVALAWLKAADSELVQAFVGVARGRRGASSR
ncbi:hypothetical protein D8M15_03670 [Micrococcus sp. HSID17228]|uniref:DUF6226 family protein n=1 Tax=Micrococcus sp. HSID17228 TaxID=2419507 RepID=UPI000FA2576E|nr:DUF6226 family protein [Micrococcus sp. HSID17228]RUQ45316.1 hypothetical protein D8M15_03670 [Micrococcus sp. HSID17228]